MSTPKPNSPTKHHVMDAGDSTDDLNPQPAANPSTGAQDLASHQHQNSGSANHDAQLGGLREQQIGDEDIQALLNDSEGPANQEALPHGRDQKQGQLRHEQPAILPGGLGSAPSLPHVNPTPGHDEPMAGVHNEQTINYPPSSLAMNGSALAAPITAEVQTPAAGPASSAAEAAELLRGNPYAFAASLATPSQPAREAPLDTIKSQPVTAQQGGSATLLDTLAPHAASIPGQQSMDIPAEHAGSRSPATTLQAGQDEGEEEEDSDEMELTQNDASDDSSGSEDEDEDEDDDDDGHMEEMRAKLQHNITHGQRQQQGPGHMGFQIPAQSNGKDGWGQQGHSYGGHQGQPGMQQFPVQSFGPSPYGDSLAPPTSNGMNDPRQGRQQMTGMSAPQPDRGFGGALHQDNMFLPLNPEMLSRIRSSQLPQKQAPNAQPDGMGYYSYPAPSPSYSQPMGFQGFQSPYLSSPNLARARQFAQQPQNDHAPMKPAMHAGKSMNLGQQKASKPASAEDEDTDDDEPLRTRVARHPSVRSEVGSVMGRAPQHQGGAQYDEHDCGDVGDDDDDLQFLEVKPISKPGQKAKPPKKETPKATVNAGFRPIKKDAAASKKDAFAKDAPLASATKAAKTPSKKPTATPAQSTSAAEPESKDGDGTFDFKLPVFDAKFTPGKTKDDATVATISIPGLIREDLLLSLEHAAQETVLLTDLFLPTHAAFSFPDPEPATALMNFHTISVMVIEAFMQFEIGDEVGLGRGHWHDAHDRSEKEYVRVRDAKTADPDEIFFAVIDRWRAGLESGKQPAKMVRGSQEFCDVALQVIGYISENGLVAERKQAVRGKKAKKEEEAGKGVKRGAAKVNEVVARKKVKTAAADKGKGKGKAAATPAKKGRKKVEPKLTVTKAAPKK